MKTTWVEENCIVTFDGFRNFHESNYKRSPYVSNKRYVYDVIVPAFKDIIESQEGPVTWTREREINAHDYIDYIPMSESEWLEENPDGDYLEYQFNRVNELLEELGVEYELEA